jgi:hypothetical protein
MDMSIIGETNFRNIKQPFGIRDADRLGHIYTIGKTGSGKSTLLLNMAISDIQRGNGICVIDPHGDLCNELLDYVPENRIKDVIYFNPKDLEFPIAFNPLKAVHPNYHHLVASGLISTMRKVWADNWGPRMEYILRYSILTLLYYPDATLLDIHPLLTDSEFRQQVISYVSERNILHFWRSEFDKYNRTVRMESISPILNKIGLFNSILPLRNIVGQKTKGLRMQEIMDKRKILIVNLSKGELGEDASSLLGNIIVTSIQLAALYRGRLNPTERVPFYLYIDEMQSYVTLSFCDILSEARKFSLGLYLTHQYLEQLDERIRNAIFGNVGTVISFRVGAKDATYLEKEFEPLFCQEDLVNLPKYHMYLKLLIDGATSRPFSAVSFPNRNTRIGLKETIIMLAQKQYGKPRSLVENELYRYPTIPVNQTLFD